MKTRRGKSIEQPTIGDMFGFDLTLQIIIADWTNKRIHTYRTPLTSMTLIREEPLSELENTVADLLARGTINEKYVIDLFSQEAFFEMKRIEFESKYKGKEIVVCGGEIFVGDSFDEAVNQASQKYPNRPFYSHSFKNEYSTF